jgi:hypothetical protein
MAVLVHPTAIIDNGAELGEGTRVWHWTHICEGARIGQACSFGQNVFVGNDVHIGDNVKVQNNVSIYDAVSLEDDVFCGPSIVFTTRVPQWPARMNIAVLSSKREQLLAQTRRLFVERRSGPMLSSRQGRSLIEMSSLTR